MPIWPCRIIAQTTADQLRKYGALLPAWWIPPGSHSTVTRSPGGVLLDTGASGTTIDEAVATELKLPVEGEHEIHGAHGFGVARHYNAKLVLPVVDSSGDELAFGFTVKCVGVPQLRERYARDGVTIVGMLGRAFLQFCAIEIDGITGRVAVRIDSSVMSPRE
jgi:Aspartyl protease